ncbi:hypothetical protein U9M48_044348 [Paspalum notatum var. saurae]|uniref:Uncharacterized protein n=1 Tax=Paspalum notatum var. saurae TaxID=547442 RepID=A0AAQ3XIB3_PASNO
MYLPPSIGCRPLTSSSITTPKLYTSLFSDSCCRSFHLSGHVALLGVSDELGEAEVGDLGFQVVVEEDVGGLDVPVDYRRVGELVEVSKPPRRPDRDPEPLLPVQVLSQCSVGDVLVHQHLLPLFEAEADQAHQVPVMDPGKQLDLVLELHHALHGSALCSLYRHPCPIHKCSFVNLSRFNNFDICKFLHIF